MAIFTGFGVDGFGDFNQVFFLAMFAVMLVGAIVALCVTLGEAGHKTESILSTTTQGTGFDNNLLTK